MRIDDLFLDCMAGISGDMFLSAMVAAGLPLAELKGELEKLNLEGWTIREKKEVRHGITATRVEVESREEGKARHLPEIQEIIHKSALKASIKEDALRIFERLAGAEARVHGVDREKVHFHEVGAIDAIIDIVGAAAALDLLGRPRLHVSSLPVGGGTVTSRHGVLPVPAPATIELLRGIPVHDNGVKAELVTPTGAAVVSTLADGFGGMPPMIIQGVGYGAGARDLQEIPNVVRVVVGKRIGEGRPGEADMVGIIEANLDDMNPEIYEYLIGKLFTGGAYDVFLTPVIMKKTRPATVLTVIAPLDRVDALELVVFQESTTLGVRRRIEERRKLARKQITVQAGNEEIKVKIGMLGERVVNIAPEYEDCRRSAERSGRPLKEIYAEAGRIARDFLKV
ncbi:MAG: nickel pincer cofactor biosynthesis protein LarC [Firmicutes bacterium]|nr:nickel pincer cofactor biosynthesis protein LarC [Bacillota bacterium]